MMTLDQAGFLWGGALSLAVACVYFMAYLRPDRNRLTRFIGSYLSREYVRGWRLPARLQMLLISTVLLAVGILGLVLFVRSKFLS